MIGYKITDQTGKHLDGGQTRTQVAAAVQRLLQDDRIILPPLPRAGRMVVMVLPIGRYVGVTSLHITQV